MVAPQSKPFSEKRVSASDRDSSPESSAGAGNSDIDPNAHLSSLKDLIAGGDRRLEPILGSITDVALRLTSASGAALAMWKDGAMVCRARSGTTAPALGARLNAETGISGECLRSGKIQHCVDTENNPLVDVEVCRSLGLRSIAVLPIQGWRGVNGILEVFSTTPAAFTDQHIDLLVQLAALAERARASQPHGASPAAPKIPSATERARPSGLLPASDRVGDVALAVVGRRSRPFVLTAVALVSISLLALVIWLGWRGPAEADGKAHAATPDSTGGTSGGTLSSASEPLSGTQLPGQSSVDTHPSLTNSLGSDPIWKPDPGGQPLFPTGGKPSAGAPVRFAAKVEPLGEKKFAARTASTSQSAIDRSNSRADSSGKVTDKVAANVVIMHEAAAAQSSDPPDSQVNETTPSAPLASAGETNHAALNGVLSAKASLPDLTAPVSQGVSGGKLLRRVPPTYPIEARVLRQGGTVILVATVMEDGRVGSVRVIDGPPVFAQSAVEAVKQWRYKPFELDGKPVKNEIGITLHFKYPSESASQ
ncbi:MAG: TonB family protein [Terriglobales bacterium]